jgi:alkylation response protein AidB-like acyl-CoA dehydrogenase
VDLSPTAEEAALRDEIRAWLRVNLPWEYGKGLPPRFDDLAEEVAFGREWQARLAEGRWVGVGWPREYGGRGAGPVEHYIVTEELARGRAPELVGRIGVNLVGPTLLAHGAPEQQARWLPRILDASEIWCQLFSEPGAGSDLTSLTTRAEPIDAGSGPTGEAGFRLNGQKVWTSYAQFADWGWCLARTDPEAPNSKGISALVVDMHAPGVEVRPLRQITDESEFNEVFFDDVFVPADQLVGPLNEGWRIANSTLTHERGVNPRQLVIHSQLVDELWRLARVQGAVVDPRLAPRLAQAFVEVRMFQLHNWRSISRTAKGRDPGPVGSINKLWWSEMSKRLHETAMAVVGHAQPLWRGADDNPGDGAWQRSWLYYQASSIWAGTNEIQRNVVGERVLGLPREPR